MHLSTNSDSSQQRGFTLIEMLVTLVLIAIITTTIMQGMSYLWRLQTRFNEVIATASVRDMHADWWRTAIRGLLTVPPQGAGLFKGAPRALHGISLYTPGHQPDISAPLTCLIVARVRADALVCNDQPILQLPEDSRFTYLDPSWKQHKRWPPSAGKYRQLPQVVLIEQNHTVVWAASPLQPNAPKMPVNQLGQTGFVP